MSMGAAAATEITENLTIRPEMKLSKLLILLLKLRQYTIRY